MTVSPNGISISTFFTFAAWISMLLAAGGRTPGPPNTGIILCLGDSLTAGYGIGSALAYPALLQEKIRREGLHYEVINAGVSGDTSAGGLHRLDWLLSRKVDLLILALGANDGLRGLPLDLTQRNLDAILTRTRQRFPEVKLLVTGMLIPPNLNRDYANRFQALFPALAQKHHAQLVPFLLEGVGGRPQLNLPDGIHPTAEGQRIVAENVWRVLKPMLLASH